MLFVNMMGIKVTAMFVMPLIVITITAATLVIVGAMLKIV